MNNPIRKPLIILFGSGEMTPTGRKIHEKALLEAGIINSCRIAILETPSGFEVNASGGWPFMMEDFFVRSLKNFHPHVIKVPARRNCGRFSSNDPVLSLRLEGSNYIYAGAGSPTYTVKHLMNTVLLKKIIHSFNNGSSICLGSAAVIAFSAYVIPVYEIYKAGQDPYIIKGLDAYHDLLGFQMTVIPHWNNQDGRDFDTSRCFMGKKRFEILQNIMPSDIPIVGIEEKTALIIDKTKLQIRVLGEGKCYLVKKNGNTVDISGQKSLNFINNI